MLSLISHLPKFIRERIMPDMLIPPISNNPVKVQLIQVSHICFGHPDLQASGKFAKDFGRTECARGQVKIYYSGYGKDPYVYVASKSNEGGPRFGALHS